MSLESELALLAPELGASLIGWVLVSEWRLSSGEKMLKLDRAAHVADWEMRGYLHEVLNEWPDAEL